MLEFCIRMKKLRSQIVLVIIFLISANVSFSQDILADTLQGTIEEVVVTATRTERKLSNVTIPTYII
jgi:outer membrane cobalamin receptor